MVSPGDNINTGFQLQVLRSGTEEEVIFSELLDRPLVVSVYMRNNTSGCDLQNESLAQQADQFDKRGYNLLAISKDTCRSHKNYAEKKNIPYWLASDPDYKFAEATDSIVEKKMYGKTFNAPSRSAFVIDTDGKVLGVIEKVNTRAHAEELLELIDSIQL